MINASLMITDKLQLLLVNVFQSLRCQVALHYYCIDQFGITFWIHINAKINVYMYLLLSSDSKTISIQLLLLLKSLRFSMGN